MYPVGVPVGDVVVDDGVVVVEEVLVLVLDGVVDGGMLAPFECQLED